MRIEIHLAAPLEHGIQRILMRKVGNPCALEPDPKTKKSAGTHLVRTSGPLHGLAMLNLERAPSKGVNRGG